LYYNEYVINQSGTYELTQSGMAQAQQNILDFMSKNNIDITLHGHIHEPFVYYNCSKRGWIMCPGRIGRVVDDVGSVNPIYGILKIRESGALEWQFVEWEQINRSEEC